MRGGRYEQAGGVVAGVALLATIWLVLVAHPLFWLPLVIGIGLVLPLLAILADRGRETHPATAAEEEPPAPEGDDAG